MQIQYFPYREGLKSVSSLSHINRSFTELKGQQYRNFAENEGEERNQNAPQMGCRS